MADDGVANLITASDRVKSQHLVDGLLQISIVGRARAVIPVTLKEAVGVLQRQGQFGLDVVDLGKDGVHKNLRRAHATDPVTRDGAIEEPRGQGLRAGAVGHDVQDAGWIVETDAAGLVVAVLVTDGLERRLDVATSIEGGPVLLGDHRFAHAVHLAVHTIALVAEVVDGVHLNRG